MYWKSIRPLGVLSAVVIMGPASYVYRVMHAQTRQTSWTRIQLPRDAAYVAQCDRYSQLYNGAREARHKGDLVEAERLSRAALAMEPQFDSPWTDLAQLLDEQGRQREAMEVYKVVTNRWDVNHTTYDWYNTMQILGRYGHLCEQFGRQKEALSAYRKILRIDAADPHVGSAEVSIKTEASADTEVRARAALIIGVASERQVDKKWACYEDSVGFYREAVALKPDLAVTHYYLGHGLQELAHQKQVQGSVPQATQMQQEATAELALADRLGGHAFQAVAHRAENEMQAFRIEEFNRKLARRPVLLSNEEKQWVRELHLPLPEPGSSLLR